MFRSQSCTWTNAPPGVTTQQLSTFPLSASLEQLNTGGLGHVLAGSTAALVRCLWCFWCTRSCLPSPRWGRRGWKTPELSEPELPEGLEEPEPVRMFSTLGSEKSTPERLWKRGAEERDSLPGQVLVFRRDGDVVVRWDEELSFWSSWGVCRDVGSGFTGFGRISVMASSMRTVIRAGTIRLRPSRTTCLRSSGLVRTVISPLVIPDYCESMSLMLYRSPCDSHGDLLAIER